MDELSEIKIEIAAIQERNRRVEVDKAWERSGFRIVSITVTTYIVALLVMHTIGVQNYFLNALIPTVGYLLSTQSLPFIKQWWIKRFHSSK